MFTAAAFWPQAVSAQPESPKGGHGRGTRPGVLGGVLPHRAAPGSPARSLPASSPALRCWYQTPPRARPRGPDHRLPTTPDRGRRAAGSRYGRGGGGRAARRAALAEAGVCVCEWVSRKVTQAPREDDGAAALTVPRAGGRGRGPVRGRGCPGERPGPAASVPGASVGQQPHPHSAP